MSPSATFAEVCLVYAETKTSGRGPTVAPISSLGIGTHLLRRPPPAGLVCAAPADRALLILRRRRRGYVVTLQLCWSSDGCTIVFDDGGLCQATGFGGGRLGTILVGCGVRRLPPEFAGDIYCCAFILANRCTFAAIGPAEKFTNGRGDY